MIAANALVRKKPTVVSRRMDEAYIKVRGKWAYQQRAADRHGQTLYFMLSKRRDTKVSQARDWHQGVPFCDNNARGVEATYMIRKGQFSQNDGSPFK